jgi:hypothetical protein
MARIQPQATVLIPTHDHAPLLGFALASALRQTVTEIEVLIIGDGVGDDTRAVIEEHRCADSRIRFFDNPKGERHGETFRNLALRESSGAIVCYLCDDDLWLPDHIEKMLTTLESADFAHSLPVRIHPGGGIDSIHVDLSLSDFQQLLRTDVNRIPLTTMAHTMAAFRRLPYGWRTTPPGIPTDHYMIRQFLECPEMRFAACHLPTALNFPSPWRIGWSIRQRQTELASWASRIGQPDFAPWLIQFLCANKVEEAALLWNTQRNLRAHLERLQNELNQISDQYVQRRLDLETAQRELAEVRAVTQRRAERWALRQVRTLRMIRRKLLGR